MDHDTVRVYERLAAEWSAARAGSDPSIAGAFRTWADGRGPLVDLGCGPGMYFDALAGQASNGLVVGLDAVATMLHLAAKSGVGVPLVRADLEALPFRRGVLGAAWAKNSYVHVEPQRLPLALADLHRALEPGGKTELRMFLGGTTFGPTPADEFPGRQFAEWDLDTLLHTIEGAGFRLENTTMTEAGVTIRAVRERMLPDVVENSMELLFCGLNPSLYAADRGIPFGRPGNRFWPSLAAAGFATSKRDPRELLERYHIGTTDLVKRATTRATELSRAEFVAGLQRLHRLCSWLQPRTLCVLGITGWRAAIGRPSATAGWQTERIGGVPVFVMGNPSGLNAHATRDTLSREICSALAGPDGP